MELLFKIIKLDTNTVRTFKHGDVVVCYLDYSNGYSTSTFYYDVRHKHYFGLSSMYVLTPRQKRILTSKLERLYAV